MTSLHLFGGSKLRFLIYTSFFSGTVVYYGALNKQQKRKFHTNKAGIGRFLLLSFGGMTIKRDYRKNVIKLSEGTEAYNLELEKFHERTADLIYKAALQNKGLYIKLGQAVASMNHVFPPVYVEKLSQLNDMALVSKEDDLDQMFMEDFNQSLNQMFIEFKREPIASASIAEVFEGRLRDSGEKVAVKMQFIDLQDRFAGKYT
ncbi:uncharacterized aarF domain-containing protein kinase 5-like [Symsagittifera roscoffensis]|uniref:uncharacterized aarF domain-containing protein kinase 5-like n=1 Tax=Symsagittifera roscoffensis TaxID=84072 RepID=UPI00307B60C6